MKKEVFIIDDDPIIRLIVKKMIHHSDSAVLCHPCANGKIGLEAMEPFLNSANPISVLLDINMPVLDGWGVLDHLEKLNLATIKNIQLYIVSSSMDKSDVLKANQYGLVKKFFHKPLKKEDVLEILNGN